MEIKGNLVHTFKNCFVLIAWQKLGEVLLFMEGKTKAAGSFESEEIKFSEESISLRGAACAFL